MTTYLKAPSTGTYEIKVEGIAANVLSAQIEIDGETKDMACAAGSAGTGFVATTGLVTTDTGLDIPSEQTENPWAFFMKQEAVSYTHLDVYKRQHIGFNEPAEAFEKETHCVDLQPSTIEANKRFFASADDVPVSYTHLADP